jgi:ribonuclease D
VENLVAPDSVRRLCWDPPADLDEETVGRFLRQHGARSWQVGLTAAVLVDALTRAAVLPPGG